MEKANFIFQSVWSRGCIAWTVMALRRGKRASYWLHPRPLATILGSCQATELVVLVPVTSPNFSRMWVAPFPMLQNSLQVSHFPSTFRRKRSLRSYRRSFSRKVSALDPHLFPNQLGLRENEKTDDLVQSVPQRGPLLLSTKNLTWLFESRNFACKNITLLVRA